MQARTLACATLAAVMGLGTVSAFAAPGDRGDRHEARREQRDFRQDRHDRRDFRQDRRDFRAHQDHRGHPGYAYSRPSPVASHPGRVYAQPVYRHYSGPRLVRGGYVPYEYRQPGYVVSNWNAYPGLYAPPYGHQWMNVDGNFVLAAVATGLIANLLLSN